MCYVAVKRWAFKKVLGLLSIYHTLNMMEDLLSIFDIYQIAVKIMNDNTWKITRPMLDTSLVYFQEINSK